VVAAVRSRFVARPGLIDHSRNQIFDQLKPRYSVPKRRFATTAGTRFVFEFVREYTSRKCVPGHVRSAGSKQSLRANKWWTSQTKSVHSRVNAEMQWNTCAADKRVISDDFGNDRTRVLNELNAARMPRYDILNFPIPSELRRPTHLS